MITSDPHEQPTPASSSDHAVPLPVSIDALWVPLDEVVQAFAAFATQAMSHDALLACSLAFQACAHTSTAYKQYAQLMSPLWGPRSASARAARLSQCLSELREAHGQWRRCWYWVTARSWHATCQEQTRETIHVLCQHIRTQLHRHERLHDTLQGQWSDLLLESVEEKPTAHQEEGNR